MFPEILEKARGLYRDGQLPRAERACRQVLDMDAGYVPAWFLIGLIAYRAGRDDEAIDAFKKAVDLQPEYAEAHNNLGISLARKGKLPEAGVHFRRALEHRADYPEAHNNLGNTLRDQGQFDEAIEHYLEAVRLVPEYADAHNNLGIARSRKHEWNDAVECYRRATELRPEYAEAHNNLGTALARLKRLDEAVISFERALSLKPAYAEAHANLGLALSELQRWPEAISEFRQAVQLAPRSYTPQLYLGRALSEQGERAEAAACLRQAISLHADDPGAHRSLGELLLEMRDFAGAAQAFRNVVRLQGDVAENHLRLGRVLAATRRFSPALYHFDRAIALQPDYAEAHVERARAYLVTADFQRGWPELEWLRRCEGTTRPEFAQPAWEGQPIEGRRILLDARPDARDALQFARYARLLKQRGAVVIASVPDSLVALFALCPDFDQVVGNSAEPPEFDVHTSFFSLPGLFHTDLASIPSGEPYLAAEPTAMGRWRAELEYIQAFKIGIQWHDASEYPDAAARSIPLTHFASLASLPRVHVISLQTGAGREQLKKSPFAATDIGVRLDSSCGLSSDASAVLKNLDLVITADTQLAHLAGALGVPVWVALPNAPDWRWLLNRDDCPWYASMRLFRQPEPDNWEAVFARMADVLREQLAATADRQSGAVEFVPLPATASSLNSQGVRLAEQGRLDEAIAIFRQALQLQPDFPEGHNNLGNALQNQGNPVDAVSHLEEAILLRDEYPEAHNNLGIAFSRQGKFVEAEQAFRRAVSQRADFAQAWNNLGLALLDQRKPSEAEACFREAIRKRPELGNAHGNLGHALMELGKSEEALACFREAVRFDPQSPDAHNNLGNALREVGQLDESAGALLRAIGLRPQYADAHNNLGITRSRQNKYDEAIQHYEEALRLRPNYPAGHNNLGIALAHQGKRPESMASYRHALRLKPDYAEAHNNLAIVLSQAGYFDDALAEYEQALTLRTNYPEAHSNLGITLTELGRTQFALEQFDKAIGLRTDYADAHMNRALTYLLIGDFQRGWEDYEWRWKCKDFNPRNFPHPRWKDEPIDGRRVLLHTEQGLGDTFQFVRYARLVKQLGAEVLIRAPGPLLKMLRLCPYLSGVFLEGGELPDFDFHIPLLSLPRKFNTTLETIPSGEPYLFADPSLVERWRNELSYINAFKVGINWQGNPKYRGDQRRSIPLAHFGPLSSIPGVRLLSLQMGFGTEQLREIRFSVSELGYQVDKGAGAFMDTAAIMMNLDLFITSDTALAHLAGALGIPTWLALPYAPDWRWLLNRDDCPWYPNMRLFRQYEFDDWESIFERMADQLRNLVSDRRPRIADPCRAAM